MALRRINPGKKPLLLVPRPFSSSSSSDHPSPPFPPPPRPSDDPNASPRPGPNPGEGPNPAAASLFQDIRDRLKSSPAPPPPRRIPITPPRQSGQEPPRSPQDIRRTLESFRGGSRNTGDGSSPPSSSAGGATLSFVDLLGKSAPKAPSHGAAPAPPQGLNAGGASPFSFHTIRESLRNIGNPQQQRRSEKSFFNSNPQNIFRKELGEREGKPQDRLGEDSGITLLKDYSYEELGKRLGDLRPAGAGKDGKEWFSLEELQERIAKLAELEKNEGDPRFGGHYASLRQSLMNIRNDSAKQKTTMQGVTLLSNVSGKATPEYLHHPPQEELLERYFHPDHMSSEEKMKLELQRVRDEFKMSENDCGSARVQIAQLTLKIKHLSSVLHKKDKHSRKGLQDMVQRRKKYLKYLRRTDWDSYCLVLSKLGLRDVPEYKAPDYKKTQPTTKAKSKKSKSKKKRKMKA